MKGLYNFKEFLSETKDIGDFYKSLVDNLKNIGEEIKKEKSKQSSDKSIPFKNNGEGNKFREWVNEKYPEYAKEIQLDKKSEKENGFKNDYIKKAWEKHGEEYKKQQK